MTSSMFADFLAAVTFFHSHHLPYFGLLLQQLLRCTGGSMFIVPLCCNNLLCRPSSDSTLYAKCFKDACWCYACSCRTVIQIGWVAPSKNKALMEFSSYNNPLLNVLVHSSQAYYAGIVDPYLTLRTSAFSFAILSSVTWRFRINWRIAK